MIAGLQFSSAIFSVDHNTCIAELREKLRSPTQEAKYVERWPNSTYAWAGWSRFDIPLDRYGGVCTFPANLHQNYTGVFYLPLG
jgi:hypothetical protein